MIAFFKNNNPRTALVLFVILLLVQLQALMHPLLPQATDNQWLYHLLVSGLSYVFAKHALWYSVLALFLVYLQALLVKALADKHRLFVQSTYLPAFSFVLLSALHPHFGQFNAHLLVNFGLIFVLDQVFSLKQSLQQNKLLFNIGFVLMVLALLQFSALVYLLLLPIILALVIPFNFRQWMVGLMGATMPIYIVLVIWYCTDQWYRLGQWPDLGIALPTQLKPAIYFLGSIIGLVVWLALAVFNMQKNMLRFPIYIRRCWLSVSLFLVFSVLAAVFSNGQMLGNWILCLPSLSLLITNAFLNERSAKMNIISFYFALSLIIFCQLFFPL